MIYHYMQEGTALQEHKFHFHADNIMCLYIDSDTTYLVLPQAKSHLLVGHYFLNKNLECTHTICPTNGLIITKCRAIGSVFTSQHNKSNSWDMQLWWLKDRLIQQHFKFFWDAGTVQVIVQLTILPSSLLPSTTTFYVKDTNRLT